MQEKEASGLGGRFLRGGRDTFSMIPQAAPSSKRMVVFATPSLDHRVSNEYLESAIRTEWMLARANISSAYKGLGGDCFVDKARNRLVTEFLIQFPEAEDFFFLDDDIGWPAPKVLEFLQRPEDVVAGIYPRKNDNPEYPVTLEVDEKTQGLIWKDGLYKAVLVPTGFLRIKRAAFEKVIAHMNLPDAALELARKVIAAPDDYSPEIAMLARGLLAREVGSTYNEQNADGTVSKMLNIFQTGINPEDGRWWGEDSWLCGKIRKAGIDIWVDPDIDFTHRGGKKWAGNFAPSLAAWIQQNKAAA